VLKRAPNVLMAQCNPRTKALANVFGKRLDQTSNKWNKNQIMSRSSNTVVNMAYKTPSRLIVFSTEQ